HLAERAPQGRSVGTVADTALAHGNHYRHRAAVVTDNLGGLVQGLRSIQDRTPNPDVVGPALAPTTRPRMVFVYTGHGGHPPPTQGRTSCVCPPSPSPWTERVPHREPMSADRCGNPGRTSTGSWTPNPAPTWYRSRSPHYWPNAASSPTPPWAIRWERSPLPTPQGPWAWTHPRESSRTAAACWTHSPGPVACWPSAPTCRRSRSSWPLTADGCPSPPTAPRSSRSWPAP